MTTEGLADQRFSLADAQAAARSFLKEVLPDAYRVDVVRVMPVKSAEEAWEIEAVVWQPNATIEALGLSTRRPVLDQNCYVVRLNNRLNVTAYESKDAEEGS